MNTQHSRLRWLLIHPPNQTWICITICSKQMEMETLLCTKPRKQVNWTYVQPFWPRVPHIGPTTKETPLYIRQPTRVTRRCANCFSTTEPHPSLISQEIRRFGRQHRKDMRMCVSYFSTEEPHTRQMRRENTASRGSMERTHGRV